MLPLSGSASSLSIGADRFALGLLAAITPTTLPTVSVDRSVLRFVAPTHPQKPRSGRTLQTFSSFRILSDR